MVYLVKNQLEESKKDLENLMHQKNDFPLLILLNQIDLSDLPAEEILLSLGFDA